MSSKFDFPVRVGKMREGVIAVLQKLLPVTTARAGDARLGLRA
jgi:hypothetical protein